MHNQLQMYLSSAKSVLSCQVPTTSQLLAQYFDSGASLKSLLCCRIISGEVWVFSIIRQPSESLTEITAEPEIRQHVSITCQKRFRNSSVSYADNG
jgi:hypothetical protein